MPPQQSDADRPTPYPAFLRAHRRLLAFGFLAVALSGFGQTFFISVFGGVLREAFELSHGLYGAWYSAATLLSGSLILVAGQSLDRLDLRVVAAAVVFGAALGAAVLAATPWAVGVGVAMFCLRFFGQGMLTHMGFTTMGRYFGRDRGKAVSVAGLGLPFGEMLLPGIAVLLMAAIGWRATWLVVAVFLVVVALPALQLLLRGHGPRVTAMRSDQTARSANAAGDWTRAQVLRDPRFYLVLPAVLAAPFIATALFFHQVPLANAKGWSLAWIAASFPAFALTHTLGLLILGPLVDRFGAPRLIGLILGPMALGLLVVALGDHPLWAPTYLACLGLSMGATGSVLGSLWPELYGTAHLGAIRALVQASMVFSTAVAPVLVGVLLDQGLSMEVIALGLIAYLGLGGGLARLAWLIPRRSPEPDHRRQTGG
jgi:MFS family permease